MIFIALKVELLPYYLFMIFGLIGIAAVTIYIIVWILLYHKKKEITKAKY